ncbi:unnamed protein product [Clavelina lepadiformis]|uniref:Uncharacterized protein n=2 Tax=Clavelina lepadiformis TaxID=159417 RepID=A0ABP0FN55_CLALP
MRNNKKIFLTDLQEFFTKVQKKIAYKTTCGKGNSMDQSWKTWILILSYFSPCVQPQPCHPPRQVPRATFIGPYHSPSGYQAHYYCDTGLIPDDAKASHVFCEERILSSRSHERSSVTCCQTSGNFSCVEPSFGCGNPALITNGGFSAHLFLSFASNGAFMPDIEIEYFCTYGFKLDAPAGHTSTCLQGNRWSLNRSSSDFPRCQPDDCGEPPAALNATIIVTSTTENSVARYVCDPGLFTNDVTATTCRRSGYFTLFWDLKVVPTCSVPETGCGNPPKALAGPAVGKVGSYLKGETVTYTCKNVLGSYEAGNNTCEGNNVWRKSDESKGLARCYFYSLAPGQVPARFILYGPVEELFYYPHHSFDSTTTSILADVIYDRSNDTSNERTSTNKPNVTSRISTVCGFPGICVGTIRDIYINCFNQTLLSCQQCGVGRAIVFLILMVIFGLMIFVGNALVICVGYRRWKRRNATKLDICKTSLAVADILTGVQILVVMVYNFSWSMNLTPIELDQQQLVLQGSAQAYVGGILLLFSLTSSLYHLLYIGGERVYAITKPLKYRWHGKSATYYGLSLVWIFSVVTASVFAWFPGKFIFTYMTTTFLFYPALHEDPHHHDYTVAIVMMVLFYLIPFLCLTATCVFTVGFIHRGVKKTSWDNLANTTLLNSKRKQLRSILKTITLMQIGFTATLIPIVVVVSLFYSGHLDCNSLSQPYLVGFYLSMANSLVNVIIYSVREKDFRRDIVNIFRPGYSRGGASKASNSTTNKKDKSLFASQISAKHTAQTTVSLPTSKTAML